MADSFMDLKSLDYFVRVAELGSITRAADEIGMAQPALTRSLRRLEAELGATLLVRLPRGVRLTSAGREFAERAAQIVRDLALARERLPQKEATGSKRVLLGTSPTLAPVLVPGIIARVGHDSPSIRLKVVEGFSTQLHEALSSGRLDLAVMSNPPASRSLRLTPLLAEPIVLLLPPEQARGRRAVTLSELAKIPLIMTSGLLAIVEEQLLRFAAHITVRMEVDAIEAIRRLLLSGTGATLMPVSVCHEDIAAGRIAACGIEGANLHRLLVLAARAGRLHSAVEEEVVTIVRAEIDALLAEGVFNESVPHRRSGRSAGPRQ
jgi:LysR family nitrogen assimilation transcriptional regulator